MGNTTIEWTDKSWNPVRGCSRKSRGCENCYAETFAARFNGPGQPYEGLVRREPHWRGPRWTGEVRLVEEHLADPLRWRRPARIFVNSMSDLFHEAFDEEAMDVVFAVMASAEQHTFQVLTKRPKRMLAYLADSGTPGRIKELIERELSGAIFKATIPPLAWPLPNVWLGVSVEDQATADERIPILARTPASIRFVSFEPLLTQVDPPPEFGECHWAIVGGESGPEARPMHPEWVRQLRRRCDVLRMPFFFKQWGAYMPDETDCGDDDLKAALRGAGNDPHRAGLPGVDFWRVGKKSAGAVLDGREWREFPI